MPAMTAADQQYREFLCDRVMMAWEASGLGKQRFADSIGISAVRLAHFASYRNTPSHAVLSAICAIYGIPPAYFFYPNANSRAQTPVVKRALELASAKRVSRAA